MRLSGITPLPGAAPIHTAEIYVDAELAAGAARVWRRAGFRVTIKRHGLKFRGHQAVTWVVVVGQRREVKPRKARKRALKPRPVNWSTRPAKEARRREIRRLFSEGLTRTQLAEKFGISRTAVGKAIGVAPRAEGTCEKVLEMDAAGVKRPAIAAELKISRQRVAQILGPVPGRKKDKRTQPTETAAPAAEETLCAGSGS